MTESTSLRNKVKQANGLRVLANSLTSPDEDVKRLAAKALGNIANHSPESRDLIFKYRVVDRLLR